MLAQSDSDNNHFSEIMLFLSLLCSVLQKQIQVGQKASALIYDIRSFLAPIPKSSQNEE